MLYVSARGYIPSDRYSGITFISFFSILLYKALILNGSTVYGRRPVSIAYKLTPLKKKGHIGQPKYVVTV